MAHTNDAQQEEAWADVIKRLPDNSLFCETVETKNVFQFSPAAVRAGNDASALAFELAAEAPEVEEFRRSEIDRLQNALSADGRTWSFLDNTAVMRFPSFTTRPSQIRVKATVLDEQTSHEDRVRIENRLETRFGHGATDETIRGRLQRLRRQGYDTMPEDQRLEFLLHCLDVNATFKKNLGARGNGNSGSTALQQFQEYQLLVEFRCGPCGRSWKSSLGWGVYDPRCRPDCDCLWNPPAGREQYITEGHLERFGCVHVFKDRGECDMIRRVVVTDAKAVQPPADAFPDVPPGIDLDITGVEEQQIHDAVVPRDGAGAPRQDCCLCSQARRAVFCQATIRPIDGPHLAAYCPKCRRLGAWCKGSLHKNDIVVRYAIIGLLFDRNIRWTQSEAGVEAEMVYEGHRVLIQLRPWLFIMSRDGNRFNAFGCGDNLLHGYRIPAGLDPAILLCRVLRRITIAARHGARVVIAPGNNADDAAGNNEKFHEIGASMAGKLFGDWRAFRFDDRTDYGERHGVTYFKPHGWIKRRARADDFDNIRDWPIVYHGTSSTSAAKILLTRLERPGRGGVFTAHGQAGSGTRRTIYTSPSIFYAGHPVYAPLFEIDPDRRWGQIVLQCKVRPGSWRTRHGTLGNKHWPFEVRMDPNFPNHDNLEFMLEDTNDVVVIGIMYRELGPWADPGLFGQLATRVTCRQTPSGTGPQYAW
eukprot:CAMPEP_0117538406 /NCGR_PEP_ID=MMETSP0784-20121206/42463_1 /TAXON_ID=39447 /ORGANISM="" /LENGTH=700 /DNA_ID=CAMNT_0005335021 /DNA_START=62 /DNA_END=2161 /DNA_ORIENTATION=-